MAKVVVMGGGPGGATAAMTLLKLGHEAVILEKNQFPRYRVGESLLPGTMSIFKRLGVWDRIADEGFIKKPSATFLWGKNQPPYTFSFATAKPHDWVFDHAIQVKRDRFDDILLSEAAGAGAEITQGAKVTDVDYSQSDKVTVSYERDDTKNTITGDYLIDASGTGSPLVKKLGIRRYDEFYKSLALWSYFELDDPFKGDLKGTTYSITFDDGWVWMIPVEEGLYSVGMIIDVDKTSEIREMGRDAFFNSTLKKCDRAVAILGDAPRNGPVRAVNDWAYDAEFFSRGRLFLSGDAACFTDPLFSQGVHLAVRSGVSAASAIDWVDSGGDSDAAHHWYNKSYRDTYERYHEFVASYYTYASYAESDSAFWSKRGVKEDGYDKLESRSWYKKLATKSRENSEFSIEDFRDRSSTMVAIGRHRRDELSDDFEETELNMARTVWISKLHKQLSRIKRFQWNGQKVCLEAFFKVDPLEMKLNEVSVISDGNGNLMTKYPMSENDRAYLARLNMGAVGFADLNAYFAKSGHAENSSQVIIQLIETGLISGFDKNDQRVHVQDRLRFDGVGAEYEV